MKRSGRFIEFSVSREVLNETARESRATIAFDLAEAST
jgi:hypothetical protein